MSEINIIISSEELPSERLSSIGVGNRIWKMIFKHDLMVVHLLDCGSWARHSRRELVNSCISITIVGGLLTREKIIKRRSMMRGWASSESVISWITRFCKEESISKSSEEVDSSARAQSSPRGRRLSRRCSLFAGREAAALSLCRRHWNAA